MITLETIAQETGVSSRTVSNVLNGRNKEIWGKTAERAQHIREVAERLGYQPNAAAKAVATGRFGNVALLMSTIGNRSTLYTEMLNGLHDALQEHNLHVIVARYNDNALTSSEFMPKVLREWMVDGIIVNYNVNIPDALPELLAKHNTSAIWTNAKREFDCIVPDDFNAGKMATEKLLEAGHKRIAYIGHATSHFSLLERCDGYLAAMAEANLEPLVHDNSRKPSEWIALAQSWATRPDRPTAIVTYVPETVHPIRLGSALAGLRIPEDLSIVTFHEKLVEDPCSDLPITTCILPEYDMGYTALEMLLERIETKTPLKPRTLPFKGIQGGTIAPPSQTGK